MCSGEEERLSRRAPRRWLLEIEEGPGYFDVRAGRVKEAEILTGLEEGVSWRTRDTWVSFYEIMQRLGRETDD